MNLKSILLCERSQTQKSTSYPIYMNFSKWQKKFQVVKVDEYYGNEGEGGE